MSSISGIRGIVGDGLEPETIVKFTSAFADFIGSGKVVVGRDARITGEMVNQLVIGTLLAKGLDVIDIGICPTPTVQFMVKSENAQGGIAISASHNPNEWNALKLLNGTGQFLSPDEYEILKLKLDQPVQYSKWDKVGRVTKSPEAIDSHIDAILNLDIINLNVIKERKFKVAIDCVNGAGVYSLPILLNKLNCEIVEFNCEKSGIFPRHPEPLPENLLEFMHFVKKSNVDLGIVVDPDVDRLVFIVGNGEPFGEENTLVIAADAVLNFRTGSVVTNLSTTRAVDDIAKKHNTEVFRSPVGEANVVQKMKEVNAIIGGEGSGGVIYPALHYGRDALTGIAIVLNFLAEKNFELADYYISIPKYYNSKNKINIENYSPDEILSKLKNNFEADKIITLDGLKIDFADHWVHFRKSNTEPIIRIIVETNSEPLLAELSDKYLQMIEKLIKA